MARLIDADEVMNKMQEGYDDAYGTERAIWLEAMKKIKELPTIEAEPVKHGKWVKVAELCGVEVLKCSVCGVSRPRKLTKYCCDCGARMDGE